MANTTKKKKDQDKLKQQEKEEINKKIQTILTRINRASTNNTNKHDNGDNSTTKKEVVIEPPDETNELLGNQLAKLFKSWSMVIMAKQTKTSTDDERNSQVKQVQDLGEEIITTLSSDGANPILPFSFFEDLSSSLFSEKNEDEQCIEWWWKEKIMYIWSAWILHCQEQHQGQSSRTLTACINGYISLSHRLFITATDNKSDDNSNKMMIPKKLAEPFSKMKSVEQRNYFLRECITISFQPSLLSDKNELISFLSPLLSSIQQNNEEIKLFINGIIRECSSLLPLRYSSISTNENYIVVSKALDVFQWLLDFLQRHILIISTKHKCSVTTVYRDRETLYECLLCLMDAISLSTSSSPIESFTSMSSGEGIEKIIAKKFNKLVDTMLLHILPFFSSNNNNSSNKYYFRFSMYPILHTLLNIVRQLNKNKIVVNISSLSIFHVAVMILHTPDSKEQELFLHLFDSFCFPNNSDDKGGNNNVGEELLLQGLICSLGSIFGPNNAPKASNDYGEKLYQSIFTMKGVEVKPLLSPQEKNEDKGHHHLIELLTSVCNNQETLMNLITCITFSTEKEEEKKEQLLGQQKQLSAWDQCVALLIGSFLLYSITTATITTNNYEEYQNKVLGYLRGLLEQNPHLGRRFLPIITTSLQVLLHQVKNSDGGSKDDNDLKNCQILTLLEFTCTTLTKDPSSAQEVWTLLSTFTSSPHTPIVLKCTCIRFYTLLVQNNKRLYSRVRDSLGDMIASSDRKMSTTDDDTSVVLVYIAIAATVCDLAEQDLIRDVKDVIHWLQYFLSFASSSGNGSNKNLVVHYAIQTLHHLIIAGELDFTTVCKVLKKKLVNIHDAREILQLKDECILEALVMLLGDGQPPEEEEEEKEAEGDEYEEKTVPPQIASAVSVLIELALSPTLDDDTADDDNDDVTERRKKTSFLSSTKSRSRILDLIYKSLSTYSISNLGIDADAIRSSLMASKKNCDSGSSIQAEDIISSAEGETLSPEVVRYQSLNRVIMKGLNRNAAQFSSSFADIEDDEEDEDDRGADNFKEDDGAISNFATKIIRFEENTMGLSLWKGSSSTHKPSSKPSTSASTQIRKKVSKTILSALPDVTLINKLYLDNPNSATATSVLLCFTNLEEEGKESTPQNILDKIFDIANDIQNDTLDPIFSTLLTSSWANAMRKLWISFQQQFNDNNNHTTTIDDIMDQIQNWSYTIREADNAYIALSALALWIPDSHNGADMTSIIDSIHDIVVGVYHNHSYESEDIAQIALGMVAVRLTSNASFDRVDGIIDLLENTLRNGTGKQCFGSMLGLGMISQALCILSQNVTSSSSVSIVRLQRVISILLEEFHACMPKRVPAVLNLIACVKGGKATSDLMPTCTDLDDANLCIHDNKKKKFKSLCVALSLALPSLIQVSTDLLLSTYVILDKCPWSSGKGYAISSVLCACSVSGALKQRDLEDALSKSYQALDRAGRELDDALFAVVGISNMISFPKSKKDDTALEALCRILHRDDKEGRISFDSRASTNLAACALLGPIPALGFGPSLFDGPHLYPETKKERVSSIVELLLKIATNGEDMKCRDVATAGLGILCSMKDSASYNTALSPGTSENAK